MHMIRFNFTSSATLALALLVAATGCKHRDASITPIGGKIGGPVKPPGPTGLIPGNGNTLPPESVTPVTPGNLAPRPDNWDTRNQNRNKFQEQTIHFALDKAAIQNADKARLDVVASFFKSNPTADLLIEGHCDERGTEGYNLALGDRRALAAREALVGMGVPADKIHTVSFGESRPVEQGHNEAAFSKNRRDEFILIEPAQ
jgi:peptidoglycan-associated lipoprotein